VPKADEAILIPTAASRDLASAHAAPASSVQAIWVGRRLPSAPERNGSGNDPTTAGTPRAAPQS
jgi:hypothetical protein